MIGAHDDTPAPLGAHWDGRGVNFALFSANAERVELCLFDSAAAQREARRIELVAGDDQVWRCYVDGLGPGQIYGYRVYGPYDPSAGKRFNPNKALFDPYARSLARPLVWDDTVFGYPAEGGLPPDQDAPLGFDSRDSAAFAPLAAVVDERFDWGEDQRPETPWSDTLIYEAHVKGLTQLHLEVPERLRGTYLGLGSEPVVGHLRSLGVTAIELLPLQSMVDEVTLWLRGLRNYWGYSTLGFFAPDPRYASDPSPAGAVRELKETVKALHAAGIEVILDVVFNHTCEGDQRGPTVCFRGIDNESYYRLDPHNPGRYVNYTGTGNTLDVRHPRALQLILDSLRYWVEQMHVDGFRFDLATVLGRESDDFNPAGAFFEAVRQDPLLSRVKLIAEPWDLGPGGYRLGRFPGGWAEWNGRYRDDVRRFWRGDRGGVGALATRLAGSSDLYGRLDRGPAASVNFVAAHDGFTIADLVSYNSKHNLANGEHNRDGDDHGFNWNYGVEGPTADPDIRALRARQQRNLMTTPMLSAGTPMLAAGDEIGRTQKGNNNAYCQDNEISWLDWSLDDESRALLAFFQRLATIRRSCPALRRERFYSGAPDWESRLKDIAWYGSDGRELEGDAWHDPERRSLGVLIGGRRPLLALLNSAESAIGFTLPPLSGGFAWRRLFDTSDDSAGALTLPAAAGYELLACSTALFERIEAVR